MDEISQILRQLSYHLLVILGVMKLFGIHSLIPFRWSCPCTSFAQGSENSRTLSRQEASGAREKSRVLSTQEKL